MIEPRQVRAIHFCKCGCGRETAIARYTNRRRGYVAGVPFDYIKYHQPRARELRAHINWRRPETPLQYFDGTLKYTIDEETGCWNWIAGISGEGYGIACLPGNIRKQAHIVHWERQRGLVPEGLELDHNCRNRRCINLDHLEPVTRAVNVQRGLCAKIDARTAQIIRLAYKSENWSQRFLGEVFGLDGSQVCRIVNGLSWK